MEPPARTTEPPAPFPLQPRPGPPRVSACVLLPFCFVTDVSSLRGLRGTASGTRTDPGERWRLSPGAVFPSSRLHLGRPVNPASWAEPCPLQFGCVSPKPQKGAVSGDGVCTEVTKPTGGHVGGPGPALTRILTHVHTHARAHARGKRCEDTGRRELGAGERLGGRREARPAPCPRLPPDRPPPRPWNRFLSFKGGGRLRNFCCWGGGGLCIDCPTKPVRSA